MEERSAYLLDPELDADLGQMRLQLPSSSSSSSPPGSDYHLGRGVLHSWGGGGGVFPPNLTLNAINIDSLSAAKPGLPRSTAQLQLVRSNDDLSGCTMLGGRGTDNGLAEITADRKAAQIPGDNIAGIKQPQRDHGPVA